MRLMFLPAYSPDLNPIEEAFSSIKAFLRRHNEYLYAEVRGEAGGVPYDLLWEAVFSVTPEKAWGWYRDCGYVT